MSGWDSRGLCSAAGTASLLLSMSDHSDQPYLSFANDSTPPSLASSPSHLPLPSSSVVSPIESSSYAIYVRGLRRSLNKALILHHLNLTVPTGSIYGLLGPSGCGKCFARATRLRLFTGECIAVEDVVGGERLMGDDGLPRTVSPGSLTRGVDTLYRITPTWKGAQPFTVNREHILVLRNTHTPAMRQCKDYSSWRVVQWRVTASNRMRLQSRRFRTEALAKAELDRRLAVWTALEWEVSVEEFSAASKAVQRSCQLIACRAITFHNPLHPSLHSVLTRELGQPPSTAQLGYVAWWLGMWLTRGDDDRPTISQGGAPPPNARHRYHTCARLLEYQRGFSEPVVQVVDHQSSAPWPMYSFHFDLNSLVGRVLRLYGLLNRKRIPRALICDSLYVRRCLLAGILDGAGHYDGHHRAHVVFAERLRAIEGWKELAATLGLRNSAITKHSATDQQTGEQLWGYRLHLSGDMWDVLQYCAVTSHRFPRPGTADVVDKSEASRCYGFSITPLPAAEYFGFAVHGGANRRFLLEDYTVTHNVSGGSTGHCHPLPALPCSNSQVLLCCAVLVVRRPSSRC